MSAAGENSAALQAAADLLQSDRAGVEAWQIADLHLTMAQLYWKQGKPFRAVLAIVRALATRPLVTGRPLKALLRRDGQV
jgi:hypothetical protein